MSEPASFIPYRPGRLPVERMRDQIEALHASLSTRRSVRMFSPEPVPRDIIETALRIAGTAPSGAHRQPWHWVVVTDQGLKERLRAAAEAEEQHFYEQRAPQAWLDALAPLGTDDVKTHLTDAPYVVVLFARGHELLDDGQRTPNYYVTESCAIAAGFFLVALHRAGLAALTHTPSPMRFLSELLGRPANERALLVIPVGYPAADAVVPNLGRRELDEFVTWR